MNRGNCVCRDAYRRPLNLVTLGVQDPHMRIDLRTCTPSQDFEGPLLAFGGRELVTVDIAFFLKSAGHDARQL